MKPGYKIIDLQDCWADMPALITCHNYTHDNEVGMYGWTHGYVPGSIDFATAVFKIKPKCTTQS
jgi:hypothetical protein